MRFTHVTRLIIGLVLLATLAGPSAAQEASTDVAGLDALTQPGDIVIVTDTANRRTRFTLRDVPLPRLLDRAGLTATEIRDIWVERPDSLLNGTLIGLAAVGIPWLVACAANDWCYYNEYGAENMHRVMAVATTAIGAGIGALVDRSIRTRTRIFDATRTAAPGIDVSPALSPSGVGVRVSASF